MAIAAGNFHSLALKAENAVQAPSAPALSVRAVGDTSVRLSWSDLANETGYRLEARVGASGNWAEIATPGANATSYHHTGLTAGTTMFYRLRAFNTGGTSPYSAEVTATTPAPISDNPLTFRVLGADPNGMRVRISGDSGQRFKVQRTTDFRNWTEVANSILLSPSTDMTLSGEVTGGFFRTVNTQ